MGKKAKFKVIRRMANNMPSLSTIRSTGAMMTGKQIIEEGTTEINGEPVVATAIYKGAIKEPARVNHEKNMKQLYYRHGSKGVRAYVQNVHEASGTKTGKPLKEVVKESNELILYGTETLEYKQALIDAGKHYKMKF